MRSSLCVCPELHKCVLIIFKGKDFVLSDLNGGFFKDMFSVFIFLRGRRIANYDELEEMQNGTCLVYLNVPYQLLPGGNAFGTSL